MEHLDGRLRTSGAGSLYFYTVRPALSDALPEWQKALRQISVSECEFSKPVDQVFLIQTGTAPGDIHVADRLSQTSCLLHPVLQHFSRKCQHSTTNIIAMASIHFVSS